MAYIFTSKDEDPNHLHAVVGCLSICHYFYRFFLWFAGDPNAGFGQDLFNDVALVCFTLMPNLTSFFFVKHVPTKKNADSVTIWKEYRIHNLIYVVQSFLYLLMCLYELHFRPLMYPFRIKYPLILLRCVANYYATKYNPPGDSTTIRGAYKNLPGSLRFFLSYAQYGGTCVLLCWDLDIMIHIVTIFGLQVNSFAMTMRKKNKIGPLTMLMFYFSLVVNLFVLGFLPTFIERPPVSLFDARFKAFIMGYVTFKCRLLGCSRFASWIIGPVLTQVVSQQLGIFVN